MRYFSCKAVIAAVITFILACLVSPGFASVTFTGSTNNAGVRSPDLELISPNYAENWAAGTDRTITWYMWPVAGAKIELLRNEVPISILASSAPTGSDGAGRYTWAIPVGTAYGNAYRIRVTSASGTLRDTSDVNFTILAAAPVRVASPNTAVSWQAGAQQTITWAMPSPAPVKIELLKAGAFVRTISTGAATGSNGAGSLAWTVPFTTIPGSDYRIRVTSTLNVAVTDTSDTNFAVTAAAPMRVMAPNTAVTWQAGSSQTIEWGMNRIAAARIELLKAGVLTATIATNAATAVDGHGKLSWTVPSNAVPGMDYRIRITSATNAAATDTSDANFSISAAPPSVTVTAPNGGERLTAGTTAQIRWSATSAAGSTFRIELLKGGAVKSTLATSATAAGGAGTFAWPVPSTLTGGGDYAIRVTSTTAPSATDTSNAPFKIMGTPAAITVSPVTGTIGSIGGTQSCIATAKDADGVTLAAQPVFTWTSSSSAVATVSASGKVTAVANGSANVTASTYGIAATASITVAAENTYLFYAAAPTSTSLVADLFAIDPQAATPAPVLVETGISRRASDKYFFKLLNETITTPAGIKNLTGDVVYVKQGRIWRVRAVKGEPESLKPVQVSSESAATCILRCDIDNVNHGNSRILYTTSSTSSACGKATALSASAATAPATIPAAYTGVAIRVRNGSGGICGYLMAIKNSDGVYALAYYDPNFTPASQKILAAGTIGFSVFEGLYSPTKIWLNVSTLGSSYLTTFDTVSKTMGEQLYTYTSLNMSGMPVSVPAPGYYYFSDGGSLNRVAVGSSSYALLYTDTAPQLSMTGITASRIMLLANSGTHRFLKTVAYAGGAAAELGELNASYPYLTQTTKQVAFNDPTSAVVIDDSGTNPTRFSGAFIGTWLLDPKATTNSTSYAHSLLLVSGSAVTSRTFSGTTTTLGTAPAPFSQLQFYIGEYFKSKRLLASPSAVYLYDMNVAGSLRKVSSGAAYFLPK